MTQTIDAKDAQAIESMDDVMDKLSNDLTDILNAHIGHIQENLHMNDPATVRVNSTFDPITQVISNDIVLQYENKVQPYNVTQQIHRMMLDALLERVVKTHLNKTF